MNLFRFPLGEYQSNCYILVKGFEAMIIDPGYPSKELDDFITSNGLRVKIIYITHGHFDHTGGVNTLKRRYPKLTVFAPRKDMYFYSRNPKELIYEDVLIDKYVTEGDIISFHDANFEVIETPGHSYGSTCLYYDKVLFSGDTLFYHSVGRTDLYLSNTKDLYNSIHYKLFNLPDDTAVYPGHGRSTTILEEKLNNPIVGRKNV